MPSWIASHTTLERHKKLLLLKAQMRWSKNETVGFLHRFWWMVMDYAPSGCFSLEGEVADAVVTSLPLVVMSEMLDIEVDVLSRALDAMKSDPIRLLDDHATFLIVHDWLDYARIYLRDHLFKKDPARFKSVCEFHDTFSANRTQTVCGKSAVPTNLPTNSDSSACAREGTNGNDEVARLLDETGMGIYVSTRERPIVESIIKSAGYDAAKAAILEAHARGVGGKGALTYAQKIVAGQVAKRELSDSRRSASRKYVEDR